MKHCEDCIHDEVCGMWAVDSGIPFVNADTCVYYKAKDDVAEVRHGEWHKYTDYFTKRQVGWICTNCSAVSHDLINGDTPFCPRCGAMMDLEDDDDDGE